jgi:hypothetical protein
MKDSCLCHLLAKAESCLARGSRFGNGFLIREASMRNVVEMNAPRLLQQGVANSTVAID